MVGNRVGQQNHQHDDDQLHISASLCCIGADGVDDTAQRQEDIAQAALFLASDDAKYVSGVNLVVDGAYSLNNQAWKMGLKNPVSP